MRIPCPVRDNIEVIITAVNVTRPHAIHRKERKLETTKVAFADYIVLVFFHSLSPLCIKASPSTIASLVYRL